MEEASQGGTGVISSINEVSEHVKSLERADTPAEFVKHLNSIEECGGRASMLGLLSPKVDQAVTRALRFIRQNQNLFVFGDSSNEDTGGHFIGEVRVIHPSGDMYTMRVDKDL